MSTTMVTGGTGFVGRYIVDLLVERGERVVSYNRDYTDSSHEAVTAVQGELYDVPGLVRTMRTHDVGRIVHTAAMSHPEISIELPIPTFAANVEGTLHLFEAARMAGVRRIVNFSSEAAYGHQETSLVREDVHPRPRTPYGVTKVATELLGDVYNDLYGLDVVSLRVSEVYGPGLKMPEILMEMVRAVARHEPFRLEEGGETRFQFVHARDVAEAACLAAFADGLSQSVYNVTGGRQLSVSETAELLEDMFPEADLEVGPGVFPTIDRQGPFDISAAQRDLGYEPRWKLERGVEDYVAWLRDHPY